jgi:hypothetical protein
MSRRSRKLLLCGVPLVMLVCITSVVLITRASSERTSVTAKAARPSKVKDGPRNLSLQPEAQRVARRLGKRFGPSARGTSVLTGTMKIGDSEQSVNLTRRQTQTGEAVELHVGNRRLSWSDEEGAKAASGALSDAERLLVERFTLDSPDQFVLAQLRGASYFTIARNVRPAEAQDGYEGPLWNLVRVDERQQDESLRPQSSWRIYFINAETGIPERVEYQLNGQEIKVEFLEWTDQQSEKTPSYVRWTSNGQLLMEYRAATVSHNQ